MIVGPAALIAMLKAGAPIVALGANKVFLNASDEQTPVPYIVVSHSIDHDKTLEGVTDIRTVTYNIAAWGASATQAEAVADAIEAVIDAADSGIEVLARTGDFDSETSMDVSVLVANELG